MRQWLADIRRQLGMTQEEAANISGIARTTYSMIETGERNPSVRNAKKIGHALKFEWTLFFEEKYHESCQEECS